MAQGNVAIERGITYGSGGGGPLTCDVYRCDDAEPTRIAILLLKPRGLAAVELDVLAQLLARQGYTSVVPEYRVGFRVTEKGSEPYPPEAWPAPLHDVKTAIRWTRAHAVELCAQPDAIVLYGGSNAGMFALLAAGIQGDERLEGEGGHAGVSSRVAAVIAAAAPTRLSGWGIPLIVGAGASQETIDEAAAIRYASADFPPTLFLHGTADTTIPISNSQAMFDALGGAGVVAELHAYAGQAHSFQVQPRFINQTAELISLFARRYGVPVAS
jgi:acetyl esterase/lipase